MLYQKLAMFSLLSLTLNLFISNAMADLNIPTELSNKIVGVKIDDLVEVNPNSIPGIANVKEMLAKNISTIFNEKQIDVVHDVFFQELPTLNNGITHLDLVALIKYKNGELVFEKLTIEYTKSSINIADFTIKKSTLAKDSEMDFIASVGLVDRKVILSDSTKNLKIVFPIGVGAFDEGVMNEGQFSLLTPRFQNGFLDKRVVISKRETPKYFKGKPFIRLLKGTDFEKDITPIGFHIEINDSFVRGFDSHGCMRLRESDLVAFHDIIMYGSDRQIPITIKYRTDDQSDSPISKRNKMYKTIVNKGTQNSPFFILDRDNLIQLTLVESHPAPIENLNDDSSDNYEDKYSYDTIANLKEQDIRRNNECKDKVLKGEIKGDDKSFKKCMDEGKRKDTLADKIYRKYMGIDEVSSNFN